MKYPSNAIVMQKEYYTNFDRFLFRTPLLSYQLKNNMFERVEHDYFEEALFLASPELVAEKEKNRNDRTMQQSLYKYFSRSFSRCTPFGLFAGCSVGKFENRTNITLKPLSDYTRFTRLDMNYICTLIQHIERDSKIKTKLTYFPNDSIYELGGRMRYVEYYYKGVKRMHTIISVEDNEYVRIILDRSRSGATISELVSMIMDKDITINDATEFVEELISSQILKSELEALVTGGDPLERLINRLKAIADTDYLPVMTEIQRLLRHIDSIGIGQSLGVYDEIINLVKEIGVDFDLKYLFQTDLFKPVETATLATDFIKEVNELFVFFNAVTDRYANENLRKFKEEFCNRYEEQEVYLIQVLDSELGLGYPVKEGGVGDVNPLIADLVLPETRNIRLSIPVSPIGNIVLKKCIEAITLGQHTVTLEDTDVPKSFVAQWDDLPDTLALLCTIVKEAGTGDYKTVVKSIGGPSAANLMGRFCHIDPQIDNLVKQITEKEQELRKDVILAEIAHLPESRIGNIALRPPLRAYEIRYLSNSCFEREKQIPVSDILISVKQNRVVLRSKKLNKEISPHLTNAHNYSFNSMPIYHFLCDMQKEGKCDGLWLNLGGLSEHFDYIPRIQYKNFILGLQKWNLKEETLEGLDKLPDIELIEKVEEVRKKYKICQEVTLGEGDNELYVDLENVLSIRTFLSRAKKYPKLTLTEFIWGSFQSPVTDGKNRYTNEFIIPLFKNNIV